MLKLSSVILLFIMFSTAAYAEEVFKLNFFDSRLILDINYLEDQDYSSIESRARSIISHDSSVSSDYYQSFNRVLCQRSSTKMTCSIPLMFSLPPISTISNPPQKPDPSSIKETKLLLNIVINFTDQYRSNIEDTSFSLRFVDEEKEFPTNDYSYYRVF
ncbi:MAG: hypothetical protein VX642_00455 [Bdellovibrionota bacterium]|nr:hypothetical protein [Bdellovibrionota bacterium]